MVPGQSFKLIAKLQYCQAGDAQVLARIKTRAGHGAGKPTAKQIEEVKGSVGGIAAETKALEDAKPPEAERAKAAAQAKLEEDARNSAAKAAAAGEAKAAQQAKAEAEAKLVADQARAADETKAENDKSSGQLAALTPPQQSSDAISKPSAADIPRLLLTELRRVGCNVGTIDSTWSKAARKSLGLFNSKAGTKLDVRVASLDALDAVRSKPARVCPLICASYSGLAFISATSSSRVTAI